MYHFWLLFYRGHLDEWLSALRSEVRSKDEIFWRHKRKAAKESSPHPDAPQIISISPVPLMSLVSARPKPPVPNLACSREPSQRARAADLDAKHIVMALLLDDECDADV
jgi:hypothetical protein